MCSETSPRISFSHDMDDDDSQTEDNIPRRDTMLLESSNPEFEFNISSSCFEQESSPADELFANGMILPVQGIRRFASHHHHQNQKNLQRVVSSPPLLASLPPLPHHQPTKMENPVKESTKEIIAVNNSGLEEKPQSNNSKSFWKFKRSSSLNCDVNKKSLVWSIPLLSRSNSTGSESNSKKLKQSWMSVARSSSSSSSSSSATAANSMQKPPLKKNNHGGVYGSNGIRVSPVLNVPTPPYISRGTASLFGLGFLSRNRKDKKSKI